MSKVKEKSLVKPVARLFKRSGVMMRSLASNLTATACALPRLEQIKEGILNVRK